MPPAKPDPERKSRSGSYVHESQRGTVRVRVPKDDAEVLGRHWGCEPDDAVRRAVRKAVLDIPSRPLTDEEERKAYAADREYERMRERDLRER